MAGAWGSGNGTTSYSENIGAIGITRVSKAKVTSSRASTRERLPTEQQKMTSKLLFKCIKNIKVQMLLELNL